MQNCGEGRKELLGVNSITMPPTNNTNFPLIWNLGEVVRPTIMSCLRVCLRLMVPLFISCLHVSLGFWLRYSYYVLELVQVFLLLSSSLAFGL